MCLLPYWNFCAICLNSFSVQCSTNWWDLYICSIFIQIYPNTNGWGKWFYIMILSWISFMLDFRLTETLFVILVITYVEIFLEWLELESIDSLPIPFPFMIDRQEAVEQIISNSLETFLQLFLTLIFVSINFCFKSLMCSLVYINLKNFQFIK